MTYREACESQSRGNSNSTCNTGRPPVASAGSCPQLPGTILRIFIPAGAVINLLNLIEVSSPGGICLIIRLPFLGGAFPSSPWDLAGIMDSVRRAGGSVEVVNN